MRIAVAGCVLVAAAIAWTCGIPELNDKQKDAGTCRTKADCSGCGTCQELCLCVSATGIASCIATCEVDGGLGATGGTGGSSDSSVSGGGTVATGATGGSSAGGQAGAGNTGGTVNTGATGGTVNTGGTPGGGGTGTCIPSLEGAFQTCNDGCDNDGDGYVDCKDSNCNQDTHCKQTVYCGDSACDLTTQYCCYGTETACRNQGVDCSSTPILCDGPADCTDGKVCCGFMISQPNYHYESIGCVAPANCAYATGGRVFCGGDASVCPVELPCAPSGLVNGYYVCDSL